MPENALLLPLCAPLRLSESNFDLINYADINMKIFASLEYKRVIPAFVTLLTYEKNIIKI